MTVTQKSASPAVTAASVPFKTTTAQRRAARA